MVTNKKELTDHFEIHLPPEVSKEVPMILKGMVNHAVDVLNGLDLNGDAIPDVQEFGPLIIKGVPLVLKVIDSIDPEAVKAFIVHLPPKSDADIHELLYAVEELEKVFSEAAKLLTK